MEEIRRAKNEERNWLYKRLCASTTQLGHFLLV